jgi:phosphoglycolate phosphatase
MEKSSAHAKAPYLGVIFDLDGTLLNTLEDIGDSLNAVLTRYGAVPLDYEGVRQRVGLGFRNLLAASLPEGADAPYFEEALALLNADYEARYMTKTAPYAGIRELLAALAADGIKLGCNSNKWTHYTKALLAKHFPAIVWTDIIGEREGRPKKPSPEGALEIAAKMELPPARILFVGDSKTDMQTATAGGFDAAGVLWGFRDKAELEKNGALYIAETPNRLRTILR